MNEDPVYDLAVARLKRPDHTLARQSMDALRELILTGVLRPGQRLNEVELAAALGASRAPLREAIQRLASQGLVTAVNGKGVYVKEITPEDLQELYELRTVLETHAVRVGAERSSRETLDGLSSILDATEAAFVESGEQSYPLDRDFHEALVALAGNRRLADAARGVQDLLQIARLRSGHSAKRASSALAEHREVVNRLLTSDGDGAAVVLERHLGASYGHVRRLFEQGASDPQSGRRLRRTP